MSNTVPQYPTTSSSVEILDQGSMDLLELISVIKGLRVSEYGLLQVTASGEIQKPYNVGFVNSSNWVKVMNEGGSNIFTAAISYLEDDLKSSQGESYIMAHPMNEDNLIICHKNSSKERDIGAAVVDAIEAGSQE